MWCFIPVVDHCDDQFNYSAGSSLSFLKQYECNSSNPFKISRILCNFKKKPNVDFKMLKKATSYFGYVHNIDN